MISLGVDIGGSSVKGALVRAGVVVGTAQSGRFSRPSFEELTGAVGAVVGQLGPGAAGAPAGLCAPGAVDPATGRITAAVNLPALVGHRPDELLGPRPIAPRLFTDAHAAAFDVWSANAVPGRLLALCLGTGVGACVLDGGRALVITGRSSGHLGQVDVSVESAGEEVPIGPDGGRGSLEAYIGLPALERRFGTGLARALPALTEESVVLRALARALRIAHAVYRPDSVVLLGGVGIALKPVIGSLRALVEKDLTSLARPGWTLGCGSSPFHAAIGAARLAAHGVTER